MTEKLTQEQTDKILQAIDDLLKIDDWDASNFLRSVNKKIHDIRDGVYLHAQSFNEEQARTKLTAEESLQTGSMQKVFVSMYASDGSVMSSWEWNLVNLPTQTISRPVYANEEDVIALIKTKPNTMNEAYVSFMVNSAKIVEQAPDKVAYDKLGKPLLVLRDKALELGNMIEFVHSTGVYRLNGGKLVKK